MYNTFIRIFKKLTLSVCKKAVEYWKHSKKIEAGYPQRLR